jgi:hypothetical protein
MRQREFSGFQSLNSFENFESLRSGHCRDPSTRYELMYDMSASYMPRLYHELQELQELYRMFNK